MEAGFILCPDSLHGFDALGHDLHANRGVGPMVHHFLAVPPCTDAEIDPAAGKVVDAGYLLSGDYGVALDDEAYGAAYPQPAGRRCGGRHSDEEIVRVPVFAGQILAVGAQRPVAGRDMSVFGEQEGLKAPLLHQAGHVARADRIVGWERCHANVHALVLPDEPGKNKLPTDVHWRNSSSTELFIGLFAASAWVGYNAIDRGHFWPLKER